MASNSGSDRDRARTEQKHFTLSCLSTVHRILPYTAIHCHTAILPYCHTPRPAMRYGSGGGSGAARQQRRSAVHFSPFAAPRCCTLPLPTPTSSMASAHLSTSRASHLCHFPHPLSLRHRSSLTPPLHPSMYALHVHHTAPVRTSQWPFLAWPLLLRPHAGCSPSPLLRLSTWSVL